MSIADVFRGTGACLLAVWLVGCGQALLTKLNRKWYGGVAISPGVKIAKRFSYSDNTMDNTGRATAGAAVVLGLPGAMVTALALTSEEGLGRRRVKGVIESTKIRPVQIVRDRFQKELAALNLFQLTMQDPRATFYLSVLGWGFASGGSGKLAASLNVQAELRAESGRTIWRAKAMTRSSISGSPQEYKADPALYARAFDEAARAAAKKLTSQ